MARYRRDFDEGDTIRRSVTGEGSNGRNGVNKEEVFSLFVDNLPSSMDRLWLGRIFSWHDRVRDVYIPGKRRKLINSKFGFVRFGSRGEAMTVAAKLNGVMLLDHPIRVSLAEYERVKRLPAETYSKTRKTVWIKEGNGMNARANGVNISKEPNRPSDLMVNSYDKRVEGEKGKHKLHVEGSKGFSFAHEWAKVSKPIPTNDRSYVEIVKGAAWGGESSRIIEQEVVSESDIEVCVNTEAANMEWLCSSLVGWVRNPASIPIMEDHFHSEGVYDITVRPLGGKAVLLSFPSKEIAMSMIDRGNSWLEQWFEKVEAWKPNFVSKGRFVWLTCEGIPLQGWSATTFRKIGEIWGSFITTDDQTHEKKIMDRGRVLISTEVSTTINQTIKLVVNEEPFSIRVREEVGVSAQNFLQFHGFNNKLQGEHQVRKSSSFTTISNSANSDERSPTTMVIQRKDEGKLKGLCEVDVERGYWSDSMMFPRANKINVKALHLPHGNPVLQPLQAVTAANVVVVLESSISSFQKAEDNDDTATWVSSSTQNRLGSNFDFDNVPCSLDCNSHMNPLDSSLNDKGPLCNETSESKTQSYLVQNKSLQLVVFEPSKAVSGALSQSSHCSSGIGAHYAKGVETLAIPEKESRVVVGESEDSIDGDLFKECYEEVLPLRTVRKKGKGKQKSVSKKRLRKCLADLGGPLARQLSARGKGRKSISRKRSKEVSESSISDNGIINRNRILSISKQNNKGCLRSEAEEVWKLGQELGMYYNGDKEAVLEMIIESEKRDKLLFEENV